MATSARGSSFGRAFNSFRIVLASSVWPDKRRVHGRCVSVSLRQQVMPEPQPSSCGSISHGIPLRRRAQFESRIAQFAAKYNAVTDWQKALEGKPGKLYSAELLPLPARPDGRPVLVFG